MYSDDNEVTFNNDIVDDVNFDDDMIDLDGDTDNNEADEAERANELNNEENTVDEKADVHLDSESSNSSNSSNEDNETSNENSEDEHFSLYIIIDKYNPNLLSYLRGYGLKVAKIFKNINDAKDTMLVQIGKSRLVVIETGTGRFTNMAARKNLVDLMGICDEDYTRISVFYTDSLVKSEVSNTEEVEDKKIDWHKYRSTVEVLAVLLQANKTEHYDYCDSDIDKDTTTEFNKIMLNSKGIDVKEAKAEHIGMPLFQADDIRINMANAVESESDIPGYKVKI